VRRSSDSGRGKTSEERIRPSSSSPVGLDRSELDRVNGGGDNGDGDGGVVVGMEERLGNKGKVLLGLPAPGDEVLLWIGGRDRIVKGVVLIMKVSSTMGV